MKVAIFWDIALCSLYTDQRFGGIYHLHLQGRILPNHLLARWFPALQIFDPEDTGGRFLETLVHRRTTRHYIPEDGKFSEIFNSN
jgi:hypothetical protein